jgi:hypothetical protein
VFRFAQWRRARRPSVDVLSDWLMHAYVKGTGGLLLAVLALT